MPHFPPFRVPLWNLYLFPSGYNRFDVVVVGGRIRIHFGEKNLSMVAGKPLLVVAVVASFEDDVGVVALRVRKGFG